MYCCRCYKIKGIIVKGMCLFRGCKINQLRGFLIEDTSSYRFFANIILVSSKEVIM